MKTRTKIFIGIGVLLVVGTIVGLVVWSKKKSLTPAPQTAPQETKTPEQIAAEALQQIAIA